MSIDFNPEKILDIVDNTNKNWIKTEDGQWHNIAFTDRGNVYLDGKLVRSKSIPKEKETIFERIKNRFEILDL